MQIDYPRWLLGAVTKIAYKQENDDISRTIGWYWLNFVPECFLYEVVLFFCNVAFQDGHQLLFLKVAQNMKWQYLNNRVMDFDQTCVKMILAVSCFKIK